MNEREALKLALKALEYPLNQSYENFNVDMAELLSHRAVTAIKEVLAQQDVQDEIDRGAKTLRETYLAQPEQEPVACIGTNGELMWLNKPKVIYSKPQPLYTTPPQRTWVGLTEVEVNEVLGGDIRDEPSGLLEFVRAIEAKLKEKNT